MSSNESMEMYLETIYLLENSHGHAHGVDIAKKLDVSKPSVTKAMKHLKSQGFVNSKSYGTITLTKKGKELSAEIYRKHQLISLFLEHSLDLDSDEAAQNACRIEHILSDTMLTAIKGYLKENNVDFKDCDKGEE